MSGKTINTNLELRVKGWKAALRSKATPPWLRDSLRKNIRRIEARLRRRRKEGWPEFPFSHWTMKPSLKNIACHLHTQSQRRHSSGFTGEATPMEKQIIEHLCSLQQQVAVHTDVVQALLRIVDDRRPAQRVRSASRWVREKAKKYWHKIEESTLYKILTLVGAIMTLRLITKFVIWFSHFLRR